MQSFIQDQFLSIAQNFEKLSAQSETLAQMTSICLESLRKGGKILFCGNGGSAADAQHLAAELVGRYKKNRKALAAMALTVDSSILTAVGNDYGYDCIFERQVEGLGKAGDVLVGLSTSGQSPNVVAAMKKATSLGIKTLAFTGEKPSAMQELSDVCLAVPSCVTNNIQEMHIAAGHLLCELIESALFE